MKEKIIKGLKWFYRSFIWLFIVFLSIDIITKQIILHSGAEVGEIIADWKIVRIGFVLNYNAAFGIGASDHTVSRILYLVIASTVCTGIITYLIVKRKSMPLLVRACLVLVITGAVGNMIDRIFYGPEHAVVDWIDFNWFWAYNFNIADSCIVVAAFMLIIYLIVLEVKDYRAKKAKDQVVFAKEDKDNQVDEDKEEIKDEDKQ